MFHFDGWWAVAKRKIYAVNYGLIINFYVEGLQILEERGTKPTSKATKRSNATTKQARTKTQDTPSPSTSLLLTAFIDLLKLLYLREIQYSSYQSEQQHRRAHHH